MGDIFGYFRYLRSIGWRGTFMFDRGYLIVLGTYNANRKAANNNG